MTSFLFLQSAPAGGFSSMFLIVGIFIIMYFFMIRPQAKRAREQKEYIDGLAKGAKVVTMGGVHGRIAKVNETTFLIEVDSNTKIKVEKSSISGELSQAYSKNQEAE